jgi:Uma2 family endonuclease
MVTDNRITAAEFTAKKHELPEAGRWHELHEGKIVLMQAPDDPHGTTVLNLSRALAEWFRSRTDENVGYACHEIGVKVSTDPDTVYCPAIAYFDSGPPFGESDKTIADQVPRLVVDVASTNDRRQEMRTRSLGFMKLGIETIWIPDPYKKEIQVISKKAHTLALGDWQTLEGSTTLPHFQIKVADVFAQPSWWTGSVGGT